MREDFFYRLCACTVTFPSLRTRIEEEPRELDALVGHMITRMLGQASPALSDEVSHAIRRDLGPHHPFEGNVRELEQCVRRVLLQGHCQARPDARRGGPLADELADALTRGELSAEALIDRYCALLYAQHQSYVEVARVTGLDRRTVKKHALASRIPRGPSRRAPR